MKRFAIIATMAAAALMISQSKLATAGHGDSNQSRYSGNSCSNDNRYPVRSRYRPYVHPRTTLIVGHNDYYPEHDDYYPEHINRGHITNGHIMNGYINGGHINGGHINGGHINGGHINGGHINGGYLNGGHHITGWHH